MNRKFPINKISYILGVGLIFTVTACSSNENSQGDVTSMNNKKIEYPYQASQERNEIIINNSSKLIKGLKKQEVKELLGEPDEVNKTFEPKIYNAEIIGSSFVYLISRKAKHGSVHEKGEKLIRIHFDIEGKLVSAYGVGTPFFQGIKK